MRTTVEVWTGEVVGPGTRLRSIRSGTPKHLSPANFVGRKCFLKIVQRRFEASGHRMLRRRVQRLSPVVSRLVLIYNNKCVDPRLACQDEAADGQKRQTLNNEIPVAWENRKRYMKE